MTADVTQYFDGDKSALDELEENIPASIVEEYDRHSPRPKKQVNSQRCDTSGIFVYSNMHNVLDRISETSIRYTSVGGPLV